MFKAELFIGNIIKSFVKLFDRYFLDFSDHFSYLGGCGGGGVVGGLVFDRNIIETRDF